MKCKKNLALKIRWLFIFTAALLSGCMQNQSDAEIDFYLGADLSYVNEMEDCGARYRVDGKVEDPYTIFARAGSNLVRVRLWHSPDWTSYSNLDDVKKTLRRGREAGMHLLLDFHYSDTWADPEKQFIPAAWAGLYDDTTALAQAVYDYTHDVLAELHAENLLPEMVQIGNEINSEILQLKERMDAEHIDWPRNAELINAGLRAVADFNSEHDTHVKRMLHIAQPENALTWFPQAARAGVVDYDLIGLSYYAKWSQFSLETLGEAIARLRLEINKPVMVVETAYPWTLKNFDAANNILGEDSLITGYSATDQGQLKYLLDLRREVKNAGGFGVVYWEPAWVSTGCSTPWGKGSHWENATFFDAGNNNETLPASEFFNPSFSR